MDSLVATQSMRKAMLGLGEEDLWASRMYSFGNLDILRERACQNPRDDGQQKIH